MQDFRNTARNGGVSISLNTMFTTEQIKKLISNNKLDVFYNDNYWRKLSHDVIAENHNECYRCAENHRVGRAILTHHVKPLKQFPELAYSRYYTDAVGTHMQLMPLCYECHEREHKRGKFAEDKGFTNDERWD